MWALAMWHSLVRNVFNVTPCSTFSISGIKTRDSALVVKLEKSLLQENGSMCNAPGVCKHSFCALGMRDLVVFMSSFWVHQTPVVLHESEDSSCVSGTVIPQKIT